MPNFTNSLHIYLLLDKHKRFFKITKTTKAASRLRLKDEPWLSMESSKLLQMPNWTKNAPVADQLREEVKPYRIDVPGVSATTYSIAALQIAFDFFKQMEEQGRGHVSLMRVFFPEDPTALAALLANEELALREMDRKSQARKTNGISFDAKQPLLAAPLNMLAIGHSAKVDTTTKTLDLPAAPLGGPTNSEGFPPLTGSLLSLWNSAVKEAPAQIIPLLKNAGLSLGFHPSSVRYLESSARSGKPSGPCMLVKLGGYGREVALCVIDLETGQADTRYYAEHREDGALMTIWNPKQTSLVATSLYDAIAINHVTRLPVLVTLTPQALSSLTLPDLVSELGLMLPHGVSEEWKKAGVALATKRALGQQVTRCVEPATPSDDAAHIQDYTWKKHFENGWSLKENRVILLQDSPVLDAIFS